MQSKILKHAGDTLAAAHQSETARRFDLSDRYLNSAAVKALMRADKPEAVSEGGPEAAERRWNGQKRWEAGSWGKEPGDEQGGTASSTQLLSRRSCAPTSGTL